MNRRILEIARLFKVNCSSFRFCMLSLVVIALVDFCIAKSFPKACIVESYVSIMLSTVPTKDSSHSFCPGDAQGSSQNQALALVPYQEENIFPHQKKSRSFRIGDCDFHIEQDWTGGGVAAVVWDAAVVLGEYLASNVSLIKHKRVLELGAGTGLAGMVAANLGADVTVTERKEALPFLESTISQNAADGREWKIKAEVLDWTHDFDPSLWGHFDLVIGADIIYIEETFPDLLRTLNSVASTSETQVLLSCRIRYDRDLKFLHMLKKSFSVDEIFYNSKLDIKIFSVFKKL